MHALIVVAHHDPQSLTHSIALQAAAGLSATAHTKFHGFDAKQIEFLFVGVCLMFLISLIDYHRLLELEAAEEEAAEQDGDVGEGGAEVGLLEDEEHRDAHEGEGLAYVFPGQWFTGEFPKETGDHDDKDELDPFGGLKVDAAAEIDPALTAEDLGSYQFYGDERGDRDDVGGHRVRIGEQRPRQ